MDGRSRILPFTALLAIYLCLAAILPAADDEFYYWCWAKELQWSYYDHPPMTAFLIWLTTSLFGDSVFGFRVPACIASAIVVEMISRLTPFKPLVWGVLFSPLFTIGAVMITPDSPLVLFWALYLWWMVELDRRLTADPVLNPIDAQLRGDSDRDHPDTRNEAAQEIVRECIPAQAGRYAGWQIAWWTLGGVILGCGVLSKYTMGLAVPTAFASLVLTRRSWKSWLPGYVYHGVVAFVVAFPILIYNLQQRFEPLIYQWEHAAEKAPNRLLSVGDFIGVQVLLFGTMPIVLFPWVISHFRSLTRTSRLRVCACFYALPLAFFLYKSTQTRLQGNWALVCFISFWPLASEWYQTVKHLRLWRWLTAASFLPPAISVLAIAIHLVWPIPFVPIPGDRVYRQIALNETTGQIAQKIRDQDQSLPVYTDSYQLTSLLRFQKLDAQQIDGLTRPSHFTRPPRHLTDVDQAYVVTEHPLSQQFCDGFSAPELLGEFPVVFREKTDRILRIWRYARDKSQQE